MTFKDTLKEGLWFNLLSYQYERHVRDLLLQGLEQGLLNFSSRSSQTPNEKAQFLIDQTTPFVCLSVRQAKEFFSAAEQTSDSTRPLLSYFGMMNLVKGLLAVDNPDYFETSGALGHGIKPVAGISNTFDFDTEAISVGSSGIYARGRHSLGGKSPCGNNEKTIIRIADLFKALPDLYWDFGKLAAIKPEEMNTFMIGVPDWTKWDSYSQRFYTETFIERAVFESVKKRLPINLEETFNFVDNGKSFQLKSKRQSELFQDLITDIDAFSTPLLNTGSRFIPLKFEADVLGANDAKRRLEIIFQELEVIYLLMFYMGSLARYRPQVWDAVISGRENKFVTLFKKFLYYADTKFIGLLAAHTNRLN